MSDEPTTNPVHDHPKDRWPISRGKTANSVAKARRSGRLPSSRWRSALTPQPTLPPGFSQAMSAGFFGELMRSREEIRDLREENLRLQEELARARSAETRGARAARGLAGIGAAIDRLNGMSRLPAGWDGEDAVRLDPTAVTTACQLMNAVAMRSSGEWTEVAPWTSAPFPNGGLQIEWKGAGAEIEVYIAPDGGLGYLVQFGTQDGIQFEEDEDANLEKILDLILRVIAS